MDVVMVIVVAVMIVVTMIFILLRRCFRHRLLQYTIVSGVKFAIDLVGRQEEHPACKN